MKNLLKYCLLGLTTCLPFTILSQVCETAIKRGIALVDEVDCQNEKQVKTVFTQLENILKNCLADKDSMDSSLGDLYHKMGVLKFNCTSDYEIALHYLNLAIKNRSIYLGKNHPNTANSYYLRAMNHYYNGLNKEKVVAEDLEKAISCIEESKPGNKDSLLAHYHRFASQIYNYRGDYYRAKSSLEKAQNAFPLEGDWNNYFYYHTIGKIYDNIQRPIEAIDSLKEGLKYLQKIGFEKKPEEYFALLSDLGWAYTNAKEYDFALSHYQQALANAEGADSIDIVNVYANLVVLSAQLKEYKETETYFDKGLKVAQAYLKNDKHPTIAELHYTKGKADALQGKYPLAFEHFKQALQILIPDFESDNKEQNLVLSQHIISEKQKLLEGLQYKAVAYQQKFKAEKEQSQLEDLKVAFDTYTTLDTLITQIRRGFKATESKYLLQERIIEVYEQAIIVAMQLFDITGNKHYRQVAYQFATKNKAIILLEGLQDEKAKFAGIPPAILKEERRLKKQYYDLETAIFDIDTKDTLKQLPNLKDSLYQTEREYELLIKEIEEAYPDYFELKYADYNPIAIEEIQERLSFRQAVVEFFVGTESLFVFTISKTGFKFHQSPIPDDFEKNCYEFRGMTQEDSLLSKERFSIVAHQLYLDLLDTSLSELPFFVNRLTIIPDDLLLQLSFEAILYEPYSIDKWYHQEIPYLLRKYAITYAYSNRLLFNNEDAKQIQKEGKEFLGFGLEYYDYSKNKLYRDSILNDTTSFKRNLGPLPYSVKEVREIANFLEGDTFINQYATKQIFLEKALDYLILHLAMHGTVEEDAPLNSAVVFAKYSDATDYLLRASDLYAMKLNAKLVFLSACNTGYGPIKKGEGMRTLARAFTYAGSPSLIASLWAIPDFSTKAISTAFYEVLKSGCSKDIALQKAKIRYLEEVEPGFTEPRFWSQTILIGDNTAIYSCDCKCCWLVVILIIGLLLFIIRYRSKIV